MKGCKRLGFVDWLYLGQLLWEAFPLLMLAMYGEPQRTLYQDIYSAMSIGGLNYFVWLMAPMGFLIGTGLFFWSEFREHRTK